MIKGFDSNGPKYKLLLWSVLGLYSMALFWGIIHHEPWRDEAQAWLLVRDVDIVSLFRILPSEVHPPLWYFMIMPLAKSGMPYISQNWLAGCISFTSVYIILFRTNLPLLLKLLIPFGYFFLYEYAVFARSYSLLLFFTAAIISLYPKRFEKAWLFGLCISGLLCTHVLAFTFSASLLLLYIVDAFQYKKINKHVAGSILLMSLISAYIIALILSANASPFEESVIRYHLGYTSILNEGLMMINSPYPFGIILFTAIAALLIPRTKALLLLFGGAAGILYILAYKYVSAVRHDAVIYLVALCACGIAPFYQNDKWNIIGTDRSHLLGYSTYLLMIATIVQYQKSVTNYLRDVKREFSGAKAMAAFLMENSLQSKLIVGEHSWAATAVLPYLPANTRFYNARCNTFFSYNIYDTCYFAHANSEPVDYVISLAHDNIKNDLRVNDALFLFNRPVQETMKPFLNLLYSSSEDVVLPDEHFYLYSIKKVAGSQ